ncbi:MAG: tetraacyldisaccharide 4'-kinase [Candidatus Omnitrophota bacterium]
MIGGHSLYRAWRRLAYENCGPLRWAAPILAPCSWIYALAASNKRRLRRWGILPSRALPLPVVSVGNLTVGGVGKTPFSLFLAEGFIRRGLRPAILFRGYRRRSTESIILGSNDFDKNKIQEYGDESALLSWISNTPIGIGRDRYAVGKRLLERWPCDVIILDDGFQHNQLQRVCDIVMLDAAAPLGNGYCLPYGPLREPPSVLSAADALVFHGDQFDEAWMDRLRLHQPHFMGNLNWVDILSLEHWFDKKYSKGVPLAEWSGSEVVLLSGIGSPDRFHKQALAYGLKIVVHIVFPDHHWYTPEEAASISRRGPVLMTEKDAIRLLALDVPPMKNTFVVRARWRMKDEDCFWQWLMLKIGFDYRPPSSVSSQQE